jgi:hypothetical protein
MATEGRASPGRGRNQALRREFDSAAIASVRLFNNLKSGDPNADKETMSTGSINGLSSSYLQSILSSALQGTGLTTNSLSSTSASSAPQSDSNQLSPFAQMMSELQQLQESDPTKYKEVTKQIAANLQTAAQTATSDGNTTAATQLNQLATDFTNASQSGQLPNIQDLALAVGVHHHGHHHHAQAASTDADSTSSSSSTNSSNTGSSSSTSQSLSQLLAAIEANSTQNDALDPTAIIMNTLSSAGITASNS